ncbi:AraC family transcriptional regulator [Mycobacterium sp.]|uniref:AraC family transcriptional regulator n=1 Tax=Mycobacterium sp. TaxID=1785 RepID=UPI00120A8BFC|nr:AraC family transcriptional regulator [Mycobacterium sp.]TAM62844.1 MAG: AraC family transcriptional regulator [Mycobacterium sp.]
MVVHHPSWDYPRGTSGLRVLTELADEHGLSPYALLAGTGLTLRDINGPEGVVAAGQELAGVRWLVQATGDESGWGALAGSRLRLGMLGVWGYTMLLCPTLATAIDVAMRVGPGRLAWTFLRPHVDRVGRDLHLTYDDDELPSDLREFLTERDLAATACALRAITRRQRFPIQISTALSAERRRGLADTVPFAKVVRGESHTLILGERLLQSTLPYGDPLSVAAQERECERLAEQRARRTPAASRVRASLLLNPAWPTLEEIAADHHLDTRTLRRHLDAEGTSFREVLDDTRRELALTLLDGGELSVLAIADRLGYADAAVFTRAFRRWTGTSPGRHRQRTREALGRSANDSVSAFRKGQT